MGLSINHLTVRPILGSKASFLGVPGRFWGLPSVLVSEEISAQHPQNILFLELAWQNSGLGFQTPALAIDG